MAQALSARTMVRPYVQAARDGALLARLAEGALRRPPVPQRAGSSSPARAHPARIRHAARRHRAACR